MNDRVEAFRLVLEAKKRYDEKNKPIEAKVREFTINDIFKEIVDIDFEIVESKQIE